MAKCVQCGRQLPAFSFGRKICTWCVQHEKAQRGEESDDNARQPVMPPPWVQRSSNPMLLTQVLVGINAAVFVGMALAGISITDPTSRQLVQWGANYGPLTLGGQWWRLLTSMFLHIGIIHIAFNMWCLWDLGALCESLYGRWTFGAVYLLSGLAASLTSVAWNSNRISAGASGAIFGIAGALIAAFYLGEFSAPRALVRGTLRSVVFFAGYNLIFGAISMRTDNSAHIGGLVAGFILGVLIARFAPAGDQLARRLGVLLLMTLAVLGGAAWLRHSHSYLSHMERAAALLRGNHADQAIPELQAVLRQRPDYVSARLLLAGVYADQQQFDRAEAELKRVLELQPNNEMARYELARLYFNQQRLPQAKQAFVQLLQLDPNSADAHFGAGAVAAAQGDNQEAAREFEAAARLDPGLPGASFNLGVAQAKLGHYDEAIAAFLAEQKKSRDSHELELALAAAYRAKGMQPQAAEAQRKAAELTSQP